MQKYLAAVALTATLVQPASATTFPSLTTIYVASGVRDNGADTNEGIATSFICTNASGQAANIRFLVLTQFGVAAGSQVFSNQSHGHTVTASTHLTMLFADAGLGTGSINQGSVVIESTESGVFCTAMIVDAAAALPSGIPLHLVRVNPHPGTVE